MAICWSIVWKLSALKLEAMSFIHSLIHVMYCWWNFVHEGQAKLMTQSLVISVSQMLFCLSMAWVSILIWWSCCHFAWLSESEPLTRGHASNSGQVVVIFWQRLPSNHHRLVCAHNLLPSRWNYLGNSISIAAINLPAQTTITGTKLSYTYGLYDMIHWAHVQLAIMS